MNQHLELVNGVLWHAHTETHCMSMSAETFEVYYRAHLEGVTAVRHVVPSREELLPRVTRLAYWAYARYDRRIRFIKLPGCILGVNV